MQPRQQSIQPSFDTIILEPCKPLLTGGGMIPDRICTKVNARCRTVCRRQFPCKTESHDHAHITQRNILNTDRCTQINPTDSTLPLRRTAPPAPAKSVRRCRPYTPSPLFVRLQPNQRTSYTSRPPLSSSLEFLLQSRSSQRRVVDGADVPASSASYMLAAVSTFPLPPMFSLAETLGGVL